MKGVKYVKVLLETYPVEDYLISVHKIFVFRGDYFNDCKTNKDIEKKFFENLDPDNVVEEVVFELYKSGKDLDKGEHFIRFKSRGEEE